MARINVKATVTAPSEINIPLVRADHAQTANIFRVFFEIFLSMFAVLLGHILSLSSPARIHWVFLAFTGLSALAFLGLTFYMSYKSRKL